jgi:hypothetical protein
MEYIASRDKNDEYAQEYFGSTYIGNGDTRFSTYKKKK